MLAIALAATPAEARRDGAVNVDIDAGSLSGAIAELSREAGVSIGTEGRLPRIATPRIRGRMMVEQALRRLLAKSGYEARRVGERAWRIERRRVAVRAARPTAPLLPPVVEAPPIIVTGSKRELELLELPMAVSVVEPENRSLATSGQGSAAIGAVSEGLSLSGLGPGRNRMVLRGVADSAFSGESQSTVAIVIDDSRVTYAAPDPDLRLVDVERVEVLKGPQGSLYGTGALGGIYRVVTRKPDPGRFSLAATVGGNAVVDGGLGHGLSVVANVPLAADVAALRLVGYSDSAPGWIDTGDRANSNLNRVLGGRATLGIALSSRWKVEAGGVVQLLDSQDTQYVYAPHARRRPAQLPEPHDNDLYHGFVRLSGTLGGIKLLASSGYSRHETRDSLDATIGAADFGIVDPRLLVDDRKFRVWDSEIRAVGHLGSIDWLLGIAHLQARQKFFTTLQGANPAALLAVDDDRRKSNDSALFGNVSVPLGPGLRAEVGARLFASSLLEARDTDIGPVSHEYDKQGVTPSVSLAWTPREGRLLFLRYGSAFRPGGTDIAKDGTFQILESDELATIEAGWREQLALGGTLDFGAFYSRWGHIQSDVLQPDGLLESENIGDGVIYGAEASGRFPISSGWQIEAGANYTRAILVNQEINLQSDDRRLPIVPQYTLRGGVTRDFSVAGSPASIALRLRYVGPARLSFDPATDRPMGRVLESSLSARTTLAGLEMELAAENLLGRSGDTYAFGNSLRFSTTRQYTPQSPLTLRFSVRKSL